MAEGMKWTGQTFVFLTENGTNKNYRPIVQPNIDCFPLDVSVKITAEKDALMYSTCCWVEMKGKEIWQKGSGFDITVRKQQSNGQKDKIVVHGGFKTKKKKKV